MSNESSAETSPNYIADCNACANMNVEICGQCEACIDCCECDRKDDDE